MQLPAGAPRTSVSGLVSAGVDVETAKDALEEGVAATPVGADLSSAASPAFSMPSVAADRNSPRVLGGLFLACVCVRVCVCLFSWKILKK